MSTGDCERGNNQMGQRNVLSKAKVLIGLCFKSF